MSVCTFLIKAEHDNVEAPQQALNTIGIKLSPVNDMMAVPNENLLDGIFSGADYDSLKSGTDEFFEENNYEYRLVDDFTSLPHETRMAVLHCFTLNATWSSGYEPNLTDFEIEYANVLRTKHPEAFQPA